MVEIVTPRSIDQLKHVRALMRAFIALHRKRHAQEIRGIDAYVDAASFEQELSNLPGEYAPPGGALLLALWGAKSAGCVALRCIDEPTYEMKRMSLYPAAHGKGIGRARGEPIINEGRAAGYSLVRFDTSVRQREARAFYSRIGFREIAPYHELASDVRD